MLLVKKLFMIMFLGLGLFLTGCSSSDQQQQEEGLQAEESDEAAEYVDQEENLETMADATIEENMMEAENAGEEIVEDGMEEVSEDVVMEERSEEPTPQADLDYSQNEEVASEEATNVEETVVEDVSSLPEPETTVAETTTDTMNNSGETFTYEVKRGDTVSNIADRIYGTAKNWRQIADASGLTNANLIFPGQSLTIPVTNDAAKQFAQNYNPAADYQGEEVSVTIQKGDTLSKIAQSHIGNSVDWHQIYIQNKSSIQNPNQIFVGQTVTFKKVAAAH